MSKAIGMPLQHENQKIILTGDGSHSMISARVDESYHSTHGAIQESEHIFIRAALEHRLHHSTGTFDPSGNDCIEREIRSNAIVHAPEKGVLELRVLEIGFGTGLNALLACLAADRLHIKIEFQSLELYPIDLTITSQLNYSRQTNSPENLFRELHASTWNEFHSLTPRFRLKKIQADFTVFDLQTLKDSTALKGFDVVFFDAFSPEKQPEMWTAEQFSPIFNCMEPDGILTTYCAKGQVRRNLQSAGFIVERLPGPPGKREILRAAIPSRIK